MIYARGLLSREGKSNAKNAIAHSLPLDWTVENEKKPCEFIM
jgi:hypothetical protein